MTRNLHTVTITGADESVAPEDLLELSQEFPHAEWGILRSVDCKGVPRYPSASWRQSLVECICRDDRTDVRLSMHLCGQLARETMGGSGEHVDSEYQRYQLNGWSRYRLPMLLVAERHPTLEFIAQATDSIAFESACWFIAVQRLSNLSVLWDPSGGRGIDSSLPDMNFKLAADVKIGFAGGIHPGNVVAKLDDLSKFDRPFAIDMESGVRTNERFDLDKVRTVLELCRPYVQESVK